MTRRGFGGVLLLAAAVWLCACSSGGVGSLPAFVGGDRGATASTPWVLDPSDLGTQRLFRVEYAGQSERVGFRLTLWLESAERFRLDAVDPLGRKVWSLDVAPGGQALFLDHRHELHCRLATARAQTALPLAHLPPDAIPRLLLGALPAVPADEPARDDAGRLSYQDADGRVWSATTRPLGGTGGDATNLQTAPSRDLARWTVSENGEPVAWWRRDGDEAVFVDRRGQQQVSWRQQVVEPLAKALVPAIVPAGWRLADCSTLGETRASSSGAPNLERSP